MKTLLLCTALFALATPAALAQHHDHAAAAAESSASIDEQKASYPLKVCAVSGEELGSMGEPFDYVHQEEGKPDRLLRMCCDGCLKKFKKDPAKYLARIDAAKGEAAQKKN